MEWSFGMETVRPVDIERLDRMGPFAGSAEGEGAKFEPVRFCWDDAHLKLPRAQDVDRVVNPLVSIEFQANEAEWRSLDYDGFPEDNFGLDIVTLGKMRNYSGSEWCAFWMPPDGADDAKTYRFNVRTPQGGNREGEPLTLDVSVRNGSASLP